MFDLARQLLVGCRRVAIVGDNLASDIAGGHRAGLTTILVLTGTSERDDLADAHVTPDMVLPDLAALADKQGAGRASSPRQQVSRTEAADPEDVKPR